MLKNLPFWAAIVSEDMRQTAREGRRESRPSREASIRIAYYGWFGDDAIVVVSSPQVPAKELLKSFPLNATLHLYVPTCDTTLLPCVVPVPVVLTMTVPLCAAVSDAWKL
jgi:hypothetical protein